MGLAFGVGSSSRGSPVCRGFEMGLGFWISARWWAVSLPWVFGFVCRGFGFVYRGVAVGLWVCLSWVCHGFGFVCRGVAVGLGRAQRRRRRK